ncbi:hypothetical protein BGY98DRAFT_1090037 [Russula aff. rugulosa BPL654]|nr:hypothetical protein BGY98DRAFT_1090037 [Russula aff. rugulosa BPL654]
MRDHITQLIFFAFGPLPSTLPPSTIIAAPTPRPPPGGEFVKESKGGNLRLRLYRQSDNVTVPVFGIRGPVEGTLELSKPKGLVFVAVRVEGLLKVEEVAGGGTTTTLLCNETVTLWRKDSDLQPCPYSFPFSIPLPTTFSDERGSWALPPTFEAHLSGLPGFNANVDYTVTAIISKSKSLVLGIGVTTLSTPFTYYPRTAPARGIPPRLEPRTCSPGLHITSEWRVHESHITARLPGLSKSIVCKVYTPASHVLCMRRAIPYHVTFTGPPLALATLLTYMPSRMGAAPLLRQISVDVKNEYEPAGATSEMWRTRRIGEGSLYRSGDGTGWLTFTGEITVDSEVTIGGFKAAALWVKDCIVFSITPPDAHKGPIGDLRCVIPVRLVTDPAPTTSEAHDAPSSIDDVSEDASYDKCGSYMTLENEG